MSISCKLSQCIVLFFVVAVNPIMLLLLPTYRSHENQSFS